jgi:small subunit ribosomal protein S6
VDPLEENAMRRYETVVVLHPELPEAQTRETVDRAKRLIEAAEGEVLQVQEWGMRDLAYPIRKLNRGYYALLEYRAAPGVVKELERTLKIADEVLRFVSVAAAPVVPGTPRPVSREDSFDVDDQSTMSPD